jgi:hypothetical protein
VIVAWGVHATFRGRNEQVINLLLAAGIQPMCLGLTKGGHPRHPLYLRSDTTPTPYPLGLSKGNQA